MTRYIAARHVRTALVLVILIVAAGLALLPPAGLPRDQAHVLGIVIAALALLSTGVWPNYLVALAFFAALLIPGLAAPQAVFSGFTSAAMWLAVSGFVIAAAINRSGLGARFGRVVAPHLSRSYAGLIIGLVVLGAVMGFFMPSSMGRAMVLLTVGLALCDAMGLEPGSKGRQGTVIAIALATNMPGFAILPANVPNVVLAGAAENLLHLHFGYADYLLLHYPVLGLLKAVVTAGVVLWLFPARLTPGAAPATGSQEPGRSAGQQGYVAVILLVTLAFWATDSLHHISPAWVGLAAAILFLAPRIGVLNGPQFKESIDFTALLFIALVLGLGVVVSKSGLGATLAGAAIRVLPLSPGHAALNFASLSGLSIVTALLTTLPGVPAVLTPLAPELAHATGLPVETVLMTQVIGYSTALFPYQVAPLVVAMGIAREPVRVIMKPLLLIGAVTIGVLLPIDFAWWHLLGRL